MKRIILDQATPAIREFVRRLPIGRNGVELELAGRVIGKLVPPSSAAETDKAKLIARGRALVAKARARNKGISAATVEREIREAVDAVRGRQRQ
jgi:hypothetical protein